MGDHLDGDADGLAYADGFWETAMRFLYLSIVIMTTTGCNSLSPKSTIAILSVTVQMIVSFLFLAVILALGVSLVNSDRSKIRRADAAAAAASAASNKRSSKSNLSF